MYHNVVHWPWKEGGKNVYSAYTCCSHGGEGFKYVISFNTYDNSEAGGDILIYYRGN